MLSMPQVLLATLFMIFSLLMQVVFRWSMWCFHVSLGPSRITPRKQCFVTNCTALFFTFTEGILPILFLVKHINLDLAGFISRPH